MRYSVSAPLAIFVLAISVSAVRGQQTVIPLWPHVTPEPAQTNDPEVDVTKPTDAFISGHRTARLTNVTKPTLTIYAPSPARSNGAAALVFPGGGYRELAWDGEGIDTCNWLNSAGVTCLLVKYRVPEKGHYPENFADLEDAQQAMRLARAHAEAWHIDPARIGVVGFSAGGNLAVLMSTHPDDRHVESTPAATDVDAKIDARPDFAVVVYPAYLVTEPGQQVLEAVYTPNRFTPPTFVLQAEDDRTYGKNSIVYYRALMDAKVPAELHLYATGGHGFGLHPVGKPEEHWTQLATAWLRSVRMIPTAAGTAAGSAGPAWTPGAGMPCQVPQGPLPGNHGTATTPAANDPACW